MVCSSRAHNSHIQVAGSHHSRCPVPPHAHQATDLQLFCNCRTDIDSESSTPATPSASTPSRTRALSSALEDRANSLTSASSPDDIPSAQDLQPSANPAALLTSVLQQLHQANTAKRKELDWQTQNQVQCSAM